MNFAYDRTSLTCNDVGVVSLVLRSAPFRAALVGVSAIATGAIP
jgi:hypothetical protein